MMRKILYLIATVILVFVLLFTFNYSQSSSNEFDSSYISWRIKTTDVVTSTPTIGDKYIYVRTEESIYAIDSTLGLVSWEVTSPSNSPLSLQLIYEDNYLIAPEKNSVIAVFSGDNGVLVWRSTLIDPLYTHPDAVDIESILVSDGLVYVARFNHSLTAYEIQTGRIVWEYKFSGRSNPNLAINDNIIFLGLFSKIFAFDSKSGQLKWQHNLDGYVGRIMAEDGFLYVSDEEIPEIRSIDIKTREVLWNTKLDINDFNINCISEYEDKIYIASEKLISIFKSSGEIYWKSDKLGQLKCPSFWNGYVFIRNTGTSFYVINLNNGEVIGEHFVESSGTTKHSPDRGLAMENERLIIPTKDREVIAIDIIPFMGKLLSEQ